MQRAAGRVIAAVALSVIAVLMIAPIAVASASGGASIRAVSDPFQPQPRSPVQPATISIYVSDSPDLQLGGDMTARFVVSISHEPAISQEVIVNYRTVSGTMGGDVSAAGALTFKHGGGTSQTVSVHAVAGKAPPGGENPYFYCEIYNASGGKIIRDMGKAVIDEAKVTKTPPITICIANSPDVHLSQCCRTATFVVSISHKPADGQTVRVSFSTSPGTSHNFCSTSGCLTFRSTDATSKTIRVGVFDDRDEPHPPVSENFYCTLSDASGASISNGRGEANIYSK